MKKLLLLLAFACLPLWGQVNSAPMPLPVPQFFDASGNPLSGGKVFTYAAGTTTPLATYTDGTGLVQNSNPVLLNGAGYPTNASGSVVGIWLGPQKYKIVLQSSASVQQWLVDQVGGNNLFSLSNLNMAESTPPTCNIGYDILWGDSAGHRFKMCNNNSAADFVVGQNTTDTLTNKTLISPALTTPTITSPTINGAASFTGTVSSCRENGTFYIGDACASVWGGGDLGAQANAAYAAHPLPGGKIGILPRADGSCYDWSTPMVFATLGKYVWLEWEGSNGFLGVSGYKNCLNFTPTTGTAITMDYATGTGIPAASAHGISRVLLVNNGCTTFGGCGTTAVGINSGLSNVGDSEAHYEDLSLEGWNIAYQNLGTSSHFGVIFDNPNFVNNNTGFLLESPAPIIISRGVFAGNTSVFKTNDASASPGIWLTSPDIFNNNTVMDATGSTSYGVFHCVICHLEASTSAQTPFISGGIDVQLLGGVAEIDVAGGTVASFFNVNGNYFESNLEMLTAATTTNILVASALLRGSLNGIIFGSNFGTPYIAGAGAANINQNVVGAGALPTIPAYFLSLTAPTFEMTTGAGFITDEGTAPPAIASKAVCYADSTSHTRKCSYNNGTFMSMAQVVTATLTTAAAATDTVAVVGMKSTGHCSLTPTNSGAAGGIASVYISNKTTDQITVTHTATAGWTFDVICTPQ